MQRLQSQYGVVGFKFDGGDPEFYAGALSEPSRHSQMWAQLGEQFAFNEFRVAWNNRFRPILARLKDKGHTWGRGGLAALIPEASAAGLLGFPFVSPDMVGGGEISSFLTQGSAYDAELMMRFAECSALFPAMQFSFVPWHTDDPKVLDTFRAMAHLHHALGPTIYGIMERAAQSGDPVVRPMAYDDGGEAEVSVSDQFFLGDDILVAPQIEKGAREKRVWFPPGRWLDDGGREFQGPGFTVRPSPLGHLNWFTRA
jgi:alpha-glucosidase (family GH31 glycosyl hydrolase)